MLRIQRLQSIATQLLSNPSCLLPTVRKEASKALARCFHRGGRRVLTLDLARVLLCFWRVFKGDLAEGFKASTKLARSAWTRPCSSTPAVPKSIVGYELSYGTGD